MSIITCYLLISSSLIWSFTNQITWLKWNSTKWFWKLKRHKNSGSLIWLRLNLQGKCQKKESKKNSMITIQTLKFMKPLILLFSQSMVSRRNFISTALSVVPWLNTNKNWKTFKISNFILKYVSMSISTILPKILTKTSLNKLSKSSKTKTNSKEKPMKKSSYTLRCTDLCWKTISVKKKLWLPKNWYN